MIEVRQREGGWERGGGIRRVGEEGDNRETETERSESET